jgi:hypothetical protein
VLLHDGIRQIMGKQKFAKGTACPPELNKRPMDPEALESCFDFGLAGVSVDFDAETKCPFLNILSNFPISAHAQ